MLGRSGGAPCMRLPGAAFAPRKAWCGQMSSEILPPVSLTSRWFIRPGCERQAWPALQALAANVLANEPDTLMYLVNSPSWVDNSLQSLPPSEPGLVLFVEMYRNPDAFRAHVEGTVFTTFVHDCGDLFVPNADGKPYTTVTFLQRQAGFIREACPPMVAASAVAKSAANNQHPAVMFEVIAKDQAAAQAFYGAVFGWHFDIGTSGFAYVKFPQFVQPLLGGVGQADPTIPGFEPGRNFYLLVDDLAATVARAIAAGGTQYMAPASADGYHFAMIQDLEGNPIGLIEPFSAS